MARSARARLSRIAAQRVTSRRRVPPRRSILPFVLGATLALLLFLGGTLSALVTVGAATAAALYRSYTADLPAVSSVGARDVFKTSRILDREGNLLYELFDQDEGLRTFVRLRDIPDVVVDAVLATEDATFFDNPGVEPRGIARAVWQNVTAGTIVSGGSTITQQLIRNVLLSPQERNQETMGRKVKEAMLALELSANYSKQQILEWYLNEVYFGNLSYGVATAARTYFDKSLDQLTLAEAAFLAGLPNAPGRYDPFRDLEAAKSRQETVLELMAQHRFVTRSEAEAALAEELQLVTPKPHVIRFPHWVFYVRGVLEERYGAKKLLSAGWTIQTTLDPNLQNMAEASVRDQLPVLRAQNGNDAALVAIEPTTGEILAMVGSPDFYDASIDGQVNAALTPQQPGSSIKPIVYLAAFVKGFSPATVVVDAPVSFPDAVGRPWRPQNHDNRFRGPVPLRRALGNSLNIPAVKVFQFVTVREGVEFARKLGMTSLGDPNTYGLSFTLGGGDVLLLELAAAYTVLANNGAQVPISPILKIVDGDGQTVFEHKPIRQQIVDPRAAWMVTDILSDNNARSETFGTNSPLRLANNRPAAAKTGTTDLLWDNWTMGYTPSLVAGVWTGRHDNRPMRYTGHSAASRIWSIFMERALAGWPYDPFEGPPGLMRESVCVPVAGAEGGGCVQVNDWFLEERAPSTLASLARRSIAVDRATGKLADRETPFGDVVLRFFRPLLSGEPPFPPTEYSDRTGVNRPWEVLPPTVYPTLLPGQSPPPTATNTPGPSPTATATPTPRPTLPPTHTAEPSATPIPTSPSVVITSPSTGQVLEGRAAILGSANPPGFNSFRLQYYLMQSLDEWILVREAISTTPVRDAQLDEWDTTTIPNGPYWITLSAPASSGVTYQLGISVVVRN